MSALYSVVRGALRLGLRGFFSELEVHGRENVPAEGPVVLIANHHNGMIDPFLLIAATDRPVTFIAKATLFDIPLLGSILRGLHCMPAYRGEEKDYSKDKNQALFAGAGAHLSEGLALGLFPEGASHLDPALLAFKHGAAKIAFEAEQKRPGVRIQLVGIHFERTPGFRGKALVQFGPTLTLDGRKGDYERDARSAVVGLTHELQEKMSEMILTAESRELVRMADLVERMGVLDSAGEADLKSAFERKKALLEAHDGLRKIAPAEVDEVKRLLRRYRQTLDLLRVRDDQISGEYSAGIVASYAIRNTLLLGLTLPLFAAGAVCNLLPYLVCRLFARTGKSLDMRTSIGFMWAVFLFPVFWTAIAILGYLVARGWGVAAVLALAPLTGALSLRWMDQWHRVLQATWGLWTSVTRRAARERLRALRGRILERVQRLIGVWNSSRKE